MNRFCPKCGIAVKESARFCNQCGEKLQPTQDAASFSSGSGGAASFASSASSASSGGQPESEQIPIDWKRPSPPSGRVNPTIESEIGPGAQGGPGRSAPTLPGVPAPAELAPNMAGLLCYPLSIVTGLIFLALRPYSQHAYVRFHAYQSIYFFFAMLILNVVLGILSILLPTALENLMSSGLRLIATGGTIWMMYQAWLGVKFKLPMIGDLAESQSLKN